MNSSTYTGQHQTTPMKKVVAGENHTMALSCSGQVFSWGSNSFGQLGHPGKSSSSQSRLTPKRIDAFRLNVVADIAASGCHSAAIDTADGAIYTWGSNRRGQLGRKEGCGTDQADATPRSVDALRLRHPMCVVYGDYNSVRAEKLALSDWHTCVVLRCAHNGRSLGQVWQFGYGSYRPSRVNFPNASASGSGAILCDAWVPTCKQRGMDIVEVSCAQNHSIALSASGSVFTWGHNVPALSHTSHAPNAPGHSVAPSPSPSAPQKVELSNYGPVASVCASQDHCAVVTQQGDLVTWGCGQQGVLGHGRGNTWQPSPKRVAGVKKAVAVAAGHQHTAVLVAPVLPDFKSAEDVADQNTVPSLMELVERKIAVHVDVANCVLVWQFAERFAAFRLQNYCLGYMRNNWDAVLDVVGRDRLDIVFEIMLPPMEEPDPEEKVSAAIQVAQKPTKKAGKQPPPFKNTEVTGANALDTGATKGKCVSNGDEQVVVRTENSLGNSPMTPSKPNGRRKSKNNKFVPLTSFITSKPAATPARDSHAPWGLHAAPVDLEEKNPVTAQSKGSPPASPAFTPAPFTANAFPEAFPLPASSIRKTSFDGASQRRKTSIGSHPSASPRLSFSPQPTTTKHMLGYDGVKYEQVTAFSLDAFLKQPARRGARGKAAAPAPPTWGSLAADSVLTSEQKSKTLKEIQQEEEATAAREREAKARLGGGVAAARQSTVNSWGLFRPPDHVSLADVQKLQEEQEFLEQQRQILAEIEREQAAKARAAAAAAATGTGGGGRSQRPKAKDNSKRAPGASKRAQKPASISGGPPAAAASGAADSQSKQNKQKKAKERKAARKAAGETFSAGSAAATAGSSSASRKRRGAQKPAAATDALWKNVWNSVPLSDSHFLRHFSCLWGCRAGWPKKAPSHTRFRPLATTAGTIELSSDFEELNPWQWEMSLLSCSRRHRSLLWYRSAQRAVARRRQQQQSRAKRVPRPSRLLVTPSSSSAVVALAKQAMSSQSQPLAKAAAIRSASAAPDSSPPMGAVAAAAAAAAASSSEDSASAAALAPPRLTQSTAGTLTIATPLREQATSPLPLEHAANPSDKPRPAESSWSAMLIALFAMIQPEWTKEKIDLEGAAIEEIPITSVPPQLSEVLPSNDADLFWRYDMDSYAANCKNEDRSQYVVDSIVRPGRTSETPVFFCGCYDGHGGEEAVDFVQKKLYANIRSNLTENDEPVAHSIITGFKDTEEEFKRRSQIKFERGSWSSCSVGACAVMALVIDKKLYVASCGDCRAIMAYREADGSLSVEQITFDHSANEEREQRRLRVLRHYRSGGEVSCVLIMCSCAFLKCAAVPDIFQVDLNDRKPEFVVLGSDGLFGELKNEEIVQLVGRFRDEGVENVSQALREAVLERIAEIYGTTAAELENVLPGNRRDYHDDITIDVLHFTPPHAVTHAEAA
ncbi:unnamed protein product [Phytophthora fragariaefolia]|uniref:Unnamed protein product n=1 Tax=Phytophthora fragariaefolia TaxID=1490495 RepID=A0A9W6TRD2_9STRA|nr:unnamed protein product [Phytophthora fragariaefolia]